MRTMLIVVMMMAASVAAADDFSLSGYVQPEANWRFSAGYHSDALRCDWHRQAKDGVIADGYDVTATHQIGFVQTRYRQAHRSEQDVDTQEAAILGTVYGIGAGVARSWERFEDPRWMAKAKYALTYRAVTVDLDWSSNFDDRRELSAAWRIQIPAYKFVSFMMSGNVVRGESGGAERRWWNTEFGIAVDLDMLKPEVKNGSG